MPDLSWSSPAEAYAALLQGNERFVRGDRLHPNQDADRRAELAPRQRPFAVLFGCSDSRLAAEIIFDRGLGDFFVVRTAGHVSSAEVLGSVEYGVNVLGAPLVVVLGHDSCGAVTAASEAERKGVAPAGYIGDVVERVMPSVLAARSQGYTEVDEFVDEHIRRTVDALVGRSATLADEVSAGRCAVVGLSYRLADGTVNQVAALGLGD
ncbi:MULTISPECIES: carbonic anhydrase [Streptomyces]|jgi:carbonic anhydrase|uniref:carbonic anhydrase n=1 Tax=Streptomyces rochei TaxID=1928 RepID=A0AAX3ZC20_STRRO|nr:MULTISPECIES: carbonic anhydrase [Streptomyces]WDI16486.1 carbonic anhydrase [Streptomyces enissocaesilis]GGY68322.1 carbonic anhydrase [Streptomyces geysiriensis]MBQ0876794.1 carbonic anhydrase [Streptomyces sp. RT42]MBQ0910737.1 carbonic anhydrase [Streptomyces sp. RM99]MDI3098907.1 carbonic anhydrase [Streptomyces sp. AN-3]